MKEIATRWFTALAVASALSLAAASSALAQFSEPAAFAAQHPDRDVLNGGALTPEARMRAAGTLSAVPAYPNANAYAAPIPVAPRHLRRHRR
jgi:hypothetical protein